MFSWCPGRTLADLITFFIQESPIDRFNPCSLPVWLFTTKCNLNNRPLLLFSPSLGAT